MLPSSWEQSDPGNLPEATADQYTLTLKFDRTEYLPYEPIEWTKTLTCGPNGKPYSFIDTERALPPVIQYRKADQQQWQTSGNDGFGFISGPDRRVTLDIGDSFTTIGRLPHYYGPIPPFVSKPGQYILRQNWQVNGLIVRSNEVAITIRADGIEQQAFQDLLTDKRLPQTTSLIRELNLKSTTRDPFIVRQTLHLQQFIDKHPDSRYSIYLRARYVMLVQAGKDRANKIMVAQAAVYNTYLETHAPWIIQSMK